MLYWPKIYEKNMRLPIIITNFKIYEGSTGNKALELAKIHEKVAAEFNVCLGVAVQAMDIRLIAGEVNIPVFAQHVDAVEFGAGTGKILPEAVARAGAIGTLVNHSEFQLPMGMIERTIIRAKEAGLRVICCAQDNDEGEQIIKFHPDLVAIEPPELIGGDISISTAKPEVISEAMHCVGEGRVIVGAGIKTGMDVEIALRLGASGVLLASGVTRAANPEAVLRDLVRGLIAAHTPADAC